MIILPVPPSQPAQSLLPSEHSLADWHRLAVAEIAQGLSAAHAALFATPVPGAAGVTWLTEGESPVPSVQLATEDRALLSAAIGSILSDVRRLAEGGAAPSLARLWPALRQVPDQRHIFLVQGRPVLAAWGHRGPAGSLVAGEDDGLAGVMPAAAAVAVPAPRRRAAIYAVPLAALAILALVAGIVIPTASGLWAAPAMCRINPGQLAAFAGLQQAINRGNALRTILAQLVEETGQRRALCAPPPPPPIPPKPAPVPAVAPPPPAPLPGLTGKLWDKGDLSVLKGCWNRTSEMVLYDIRTGRPITVQSWRMCFDENGVGTQEILETDGRHCSGPLMAHFEGTILMIAEPQVCSGTFTLVHGATACQRVSIDDADCTRREDKSGSSSRGSFRR